MLEKADGLDTGPLPWVGDGQTAQGIALESDAGDLEGRVGHALADERPDLLAEPVETEHVG